MAKMIGYREFIQYIILNDDTHDLIEGREFWPTILMSAASHLYDKDSEEVFKDLLRVKADYLKKGYITGG